MRRIVLTTALTACLLAPTVAGAATRYVISGAGFGHGIGMSQYGALGFANKGFEYRSILRHYYSGTTLGRTAGRAIRVLLETRDRIVVHAVVRDQHKRLKKVTYVATATASGFDLRDAGGRLFGRYSGPVAVRSTTGVVRLEGLALNGVSGGAYRGAIELRPGIGGLLAVNVLPLDSYVAGVVPGEVPASWPLEALKAQAVAARTYALATDAGGTLFDQYPDTRSQEYKGLSAEARRSSAAVRATAGEVVLYRGALATTYFFSTSGGRTENVENVFYGTRPQHYLVSVDDPYEGAGERHRWQFNLDRSQLGARLGSFCRGRFSALRVLRRGVSPRIISANVVCSQGTVRATGVQLRRALSLYDTWFTLTRVSIAAAHPAAARTLLGRLLAPRRGLEGSFDPAPVQRSLVVERLVHRHFVASGTVETTASGDYTSALRSPGTYRVRAGTVSSAPVRIG